jgi:RNA polymerase sigma-70 factor (ECF subfamily)
LVVEVNLKALKIISFYSSEKQLIKKAVDGDREAQKRLYEHHAPKMLSVCRQYVKDLHFAEDVMINGFVKVFKYLGDFRFEGSFEGWIRRIMVRESITHLRKQQFVVFDDGIFEKTASPSITTSTDIDVAHIQSLIDGLPEGYRAVFVLFAVEGYSHSEIAEMLDISEGTSRSQLFKSRKMLKEQLKKQNIIGYGTE